MLDPARTSRSRSRKLPTRGVLIVVATLAIYVVARPWLQQQLGIPLPDLFETQEQVVPPPANPPRPTAGAERGPALNDGGASDWSSQELEQPAAAGAASAPGEARLGELTDLGRDRLRSTAGLIYEPQRSEHRLEHVLRHARDDPSRPVHGVFDGDREQILAVIDEAWILARDGRPPRVQREQQRDRTVLLVDLGRKIGYMGGQAGKRRSFPPCRHLQLVVEGNQVITAYPVIPR